MATFFITSSLMVVIVLIARFLLKNKTSFLILYPLWGIVLLRLLIPVTFIESNASIMNLIYGLNSNKETSHPAKNPTEKLQEELQEKTEDNNKTNKTPVYNNQNNLINGTGSITKIKEDKNKDNNITTPVENRETTDGELPENRTRVTENNLYNFLIKAAIIIWISGSTIFFTLVVTSNIIFSRKLKKTRKHILTNKNGVNVFISEAVNTPCIAGIIHPSIYLPTDKDIDQADYNNTQNKYLEQVLAHEYTHIRHKDNIWSLMRTICLGIYWFNPFVWIAAFYSKQDAELACDEAVLKNCTHDEKYNYGKMLLTMSQKKIKNNLCITTAMAGNKNNLRERIIMISNSDKRKFKKHHAVLTVAITVMLAGCGMTKETTTMPANLTDNTANQAEETKKPVKTVNKTDNSKNSVNNNKEYGIEKIFQDFINNKIKSRPEWSKWKGNTKDLYFSIQYAQDNSPYLLVTTDVITDTNETIDAFVYYYDQEQKNIELLTYLASNGTADPIKIKDGEFVISTHHSLRRYNWTGNQISAEEIYGYFMEEEKYTYSYIKWNVPFYNRKMRLDARKTYSKDKIDTYAYDTTTVENLAPAKASHFYNKYASANPVPFYSNTEENWNKFYSDGSLRGSIHRVTWHNVNDNDGNNDTIIEIVSVLSYNDFIKAEEESSILVNGSRLSYSGKFNDEEVLFFLNKGYTIRAFILRTGPAEYASYDVYALDTSGWNEKDVLRDKTSSANSPEIFINLKKSKLTRADFDNDGEKEIAFYMTENPYTLNEYKTLYMFDQESYGNGYKTYRLYSYTKDDYRYFAEQVCANFDNSYGTDRTQQLKQGNYFKNIQNKPGSNNYKSKKNIIPGDTLGSYNYIISDKNYKNEYEFGSKNNYYITLEDDKTEIKTDIGISYNKKGENQKYNAEFNAILQYKGDGNFALEAPYTFKNLS